MLTKKYFSISEACDMCALAPHKLRYIDKIDKNISIVKIRGRRYYTLENMNYLVNKYSSIDALIINDTIQKPSIIESTTNQKTISTQPTKIDHQFIAKINQLLENFQILEARLR